MAGGLGYGALGLVFEVFRVHVLGFRILALNAQD